MDCKQVDKLLVDYLYEEASPDQRAAIEIHLQGCLNCSHALEAFRDTRKLVGQFKTPDFSQTINTRLMQEATKVAESAEKSFSQNLRNLLNAVVLHPAMSAAVMFILVLGVGLYVYRVGEQPVDTGLPMAEKREVVTTAEQKDRDAKERAIGLANPAAKTTSEALAGAPLREERPIVGRKMKYKKSQRLDIGGGGQKRKSVVMEKVAIGTPRTAGEEAEESQIRSKSVNKVGKRMRGLFGTTGSQPKAEVVFAARPAFAEKEVLADESKVRDNNFLQLHGAAKAGQCDQVFKLANELLRKNLRLRNKIIVVIRPCAVALAKQPIAALRTAQKMVPPLADHLEELVKQEQAK
ncbi:MAG: zf-HC2 domain-containing protein [Pseudomonadota bacterium]